MWWLLFFVLSVLFFHDSCSYPMNFPVFIIYFSTSQLRKRIVIKIKCRRANGHFDVYFWRIRSVLWGEKWMERCSFLARFRNPTFDVLCFKNTFPYLYFDPACKQCLPLRKRLKKNKWNYQFRNFCTDDTDQSLFDFPKTIVLTVIKMILSIKSNSVFTSVSYFLPKNGNSEK